MKKTVIQTLLVLFGATALILLAGHYADQRQLRQHEQQNHTRLLGIQQQLQQQLDTLVHENEQLAEWLSAHPAALDDLPGQLPPQVRIERPLVSITISRNFKVVHVVPEAGNESILEMDYLLHPENIVSVRRAFSTKATTVSHIDNLRQTDRPGLLIRTPLISESTADESWLVSAAIDIDQLLQVSGHAGNDAYQLLLRLEQQQQGNQMIQGLAEVFSSLPAGVRVNLPDDTSLELRTLMRQPGAGGEYSHSDLIRVTGALATSLLLLVILQRNGLLRGLAVVHRRITLRLALLAITLLPLLVLIILIETLYSSSAQRSAEQLVKSRTEALARQVSAEIKAHLDIPSQAIFNAELFQRDLLTPERPEQILGFFASQLRIQPRLTFLAVANTEGEFYAASRPPAGIDRTLRLLWASRETGREMRIHWVSDANRPSRHFVRGNPAFDGRDEPWYQQARINLSLQWYAPSNYRIEDQRGQYQGLGLGIATPLFNSENVFIGVFMADTALSQLQQILKDHGQNQGAILALGEQDGHLLALSTGEPAFLHPDQGMQRLHMSDSSNAAIRAAGLLAASGNAGVQGSSRLLVDGRPHFLDWRHIHIPEGHHLTLAVAMPIEGQAGAIDRIWREGLFLGWLIFSASVLVIIFITHWLLQPLLALERWATKLRKGHWNAALPSVGPIREVSSLARSLDTMARRLRRHTTELEQQVSLRTEELHEANRKLEQLSMTDGLTGLANRRCLDEQSKHLWQQAQRHQERFAILMIDIDWFKNYNDHYGHQLGDETLRQVARVLHNYARRPGDLAARYGGEEFILILSDTSAAAAGQIAEQIRHAIASKKIEHSHSPLQHVTVSIGISACSAASPELELEGLLARADTALYRAKAGGRNQVVIDP